MLILKILWNKNKSGILHKNVIWAITLLLKAYKNNIFY